MPMGALSPGPADLKLQWLRCGNEDLRLPGSSKSTVMASPYFYNLPNSPGGWLWSSFTWKVLLVFAPPSTPPDLISHNLSGATWRQVRVIGRECKVSQSRKCKVLTPGTTTDQGQEQLESQPCLCPCPLLETGQCPGSPPTEP